MPKVVNGFSWKFVCKMGKGPRTSLYNIGGDPLTQLHFVNYLKKKKIPKETLTVRKWTENILLVTHWPTFATKRTFQLKHGTSLVIEVIARQP